MGRTIGAALVGADPVAVVSSSALAGWALLIAPLLLLLSGVASAQPAAGSPQATIAAGAQLRSLDGTLARTSDPQVENGVQLRAAAIARSAGESLVKLQSDLRRVDEQTAQLGPPAKGVVEAPDIRERRSEFASRHAVLDAAVRRTRLVAAQAGHVVAEVHRRRAEAFSARLSNRVDPPFLPAFWSAAVGSMPAGLMRLDAFMTGQTAATVRGIGSGRGWLAMLGLVAVVVLVFPVRIALKHGGQRVMIDHAPGSRLRRSGLALWLVLINTVLPWVGGVALVQSFSAAGMLDPAWEPLALSFQLALLMAALIDALGGALLQRRQPSWRLTPVGDRTAERLRPWTRLAAAVACLSILFSALGEAAALPAPMRVGGDLFVTVVHLALILGMLVVIGRIRILAAAETVEDRRDDQSLAGIALVLLAAWGGVGLAAFAAAAGYVQFALMTSRLLLWLPTVAAALYLLLLAIDDLCTELIAGGSAVGRTMHDAFGLRLSTVDQAGVALSATLRVVLVLSAVGVAFAPFGANFGRLVETVDDISHGITLGEVTIAPFEILRALAVLAVGLLVVRLVQRWLADRYLPTTELDPAARNSISTITTYLGIIVVVLWALTALGIGFQRVALLLSALSVGIGFGLQAITQNFVSGLILLIERPVKIGDLVRVGDMEGDVRRIRVRATEIVAGDRSTLIVPNSELITKTVRNMTLADPIGRVQISFAIPLGRGIEAVRAIMLDLFAADSAVMADPPPTVSLDSLGDGAAHFSCVGFVASPRQVAATRSDLLFDLVAALGRAGIELGSPAAAAPSPAVADD